MPDFLKKIYEAGVAFKISMLSCPGRRWTNKIPDIDCDQCLKRGTQSWMFALPGSAIVQVAKEVWRTCGKSNRNETILLRTMRILPRPLG